MAFPSTQSHSRRLCSCTAPAGGRCQPVPSRVFCSPCASLCVSLSAAWIREGTTETREAAGMEEGRGMSPRTTAKTGGDSARGTRETEETGETTPEGEVLETRETETATIALLTGTETAAASEETTTTRASAIENETEAAAQTVRTTEARHFADTQAARAATVIRVRLPTCTGGAPLGVARGSERGETHFRLRRIPPLRATRTARRTEEGEAGKKRGREAEEAGTAAWTRATRAKRRI